MYGSTNDKKRLKDSRKRLEIFYDQIPDTKGCMENNKPGKENGCGSWCCFLQSPQVLYVEFLNSWHSISNEWTDIQITELIERCLRKYLFPNKDKSCVFINRETNLCGQHKSRPFNCRTYGIIPEEEFKPRYERLKVIYPDARNQCNLVSTISGKNVSTADMDNWWTQLNAIEISIGIDKELITDNPGGSYRSYHDHILIKLLGEKGMEQLSELRTKGSEREKDHTIRKILQAIADFKEKSNVREKGDDPASSS